VCSASGPAKTVLFLLPDPVCRPNVKTEAGCLRDLAEYKLAKESIDSCHFRGQFSDTTFTRSSLQAEVGCTRAVPTLWLHQDGRCGSKSLDRVSASLC
jgi:hypothetical protein